MQENEKKEKRTDGTNTGGFHIEADRISDGISVSVCGVLSILDFSTELAILKIRRGRIRVRGGGLSIAVYENRTVEIFGKVEALEFL